MNKLLSSLMIVMFLLSAPSAKADWGSGLIRTTAGAGFVVGTILEAFSIWRQFEQLDATTELKDGAGNQNCTDVCAENTEKISYQGDISRHWQIGGIALSLATTAVLVSGFPTLACAKDYVVIPVFVAGGAATLSFGAQLVANGYLWNLDSEYSEEIPDETEEQLKDAEEKGIAPLVLTGIVALPGLLLGSGWLIVRACACGE